MASQILNPFHVFTDREGDPIDSGFIFIGEENQNPEVSAISVFWDESLITPAAQPIRTIGGYPSRNGTPAIVYVQQDNYSITVRDKNGLLVFSSLSATSQSELAQSLGQIIDISNGVLNAAGTGNLWVGDSPPAKIHRLKDRLFIGDLTDNDGANPTVFATWAGQLPQPGYDWIERNATAGSYASKGAIGFVGAAHTLDLVAISAAAIGLIGVGLNDNSTTQTNAWAQYLDAKSNADALGPTWGCELEITNLGTYIGDYDASARKTFGLDIGAGGDPAINGATDSVTFGLRFFSNGANFGVGISFGAGSLRDFTDTEGLTYRRAMVMRANQALTWEDSSGNSLGKLWSTVTGESSETSIQLSNNNVFLKGASGAPISQFGNVAGAANHAFITNSVAGSSPSYAVAGTDPDIDIRLIPKGTAGRIRFGSFIATGDVAVSGYIEIKDSSGATRKLAVVA